MSYLKAPLTSTRITFIASWYILAWQTNMEPENGDLEDVIPFLMGDFQVPF